MRHPIVNFAPDGFAGRSVAVQAANEHGYDDGLVHGHGWAKDCAGPARRPASGHSDAERGYDDGLVHSHGWAVSGR